MLAASLDVPFKARPPPCLAIEKIEQSEAKTEGRRYFLASRKIFVQVPQKMKKQEVMETFFIIDSECSSASSIQLRRP